MGGGLSGFVQTVLGPVAPGTLGVTLPHEHILTTLEVYLEEPRNEAEARLLEETHSPAVAESSVEELAAYRVAEVTAQAPSGGIPCGVLGAIGLSSPMTAAERKVLRVVAIAERGAFVEYDFFGWGEVAATAEHFVHSDRERVAGVADLLRAGHRDRVLLSQDVVTRVQLAEYAAAATRAWRAICRRCLRNTASAEKSCAGS